MCVILYTTVLALEFAPVVLERFSWAVPIIRLLRRATLPLVILGIALSTLHQSSLGTLFLLSGARMHPLWFSPMLPLLFLISAVGLGLGMVTVESLVSSWLYRREAEWDVLRGLTRVASVVLVAYFVVRMGDLVWRGEIGRALDGSWFAVLFWVEMLLSTIAPVALFLRSRTDDGRWAIAWGAFLMLAGFVLHRANVAGISHIAITGQVYIPAPTEVAVSLGVVSGLGLIFLFFVENLKVWEEPPDVSDHFTPAAVDPVSSQYIGSPWLGEGQRAALALDLWGRGGRGPGRGPDRVAVPERRSPHPPSPQRGGGGHPAPRGSRTPLRGRLPDGDRGDDRGGRGSRPPAGRHPDRQRGRGTLRPLSPRRPPAPPGRRGLLCGLPPPERPPGPRHVLLPLPPGHVPLDRHLRPRAARRRPRREPLVHRVSR